MDKVTLDATTNCYTLSSEALDEAWFNDEKFYLHFSHDPGTAGFVHCLVPEYTTAYTDTTICQGMGVQMEDTDIIFRANVVTLSEEEPYDQKTLIDHSASEIETADTDILMDAIRQRGRASHACRPVGRQAAAIRSTALVNNNWPPVVAWLDLFVQVVLLLRALHDVVERQYAHRQAPAILYEQCQPGEGGQDQMGGSKHQGYYKQPLRRGVSLGVVTPYARHKF